jgi:hypothetical protein
MKKIKTAGDKKDSEIKMIYASKTEVEKTTRKCLRKYHKVFKELAKR